MTYQIRRAYRIALVAMLVARGPASAQETTPVVVLPEPQNALDVSLLAQTAPDHAVLRVRLVAGKPVRVEIPAGTLFVPEAVGARAGGDPQGVVAIEAVSVAVGGDVTRPFRYAAVPAPSFTRVATASESGPPGAASRTWIDIPVEIACFEEDKHDPQPTTKWHLASEQEVERLHLAQVRREVRQLAEGIARVDREVADLAGKVRRQKRADGWHVVYDGEPLSEAAGHLLRSADFAVTNGGSVSGRLNRSVVVQFAVWALRGTLRRPQFEAVLSKPRYADLQPRARSLRWSIEHLLSAAGLDEDRFERADDDSK